MRSKEAEGENLRLGTSVFIVQTHNSGHSAISAVRDSFEEAIQASKQTARAILDGWEASSNRSGCSTVYIVVTHFHTHGKVWGAGVCPVHRAMLERRGKSINLSVEGVTTPLGWMNTQGQKEETEDKQDAKV
jgi:hypothetical protein